MNAGRIASLTFGAALTFALLPPVGSALAQQAATATVDRSLIPYAKRSDSVHLPDGRTIHIVCMGQGSPTVILTAGSGDWGISWNKVQPSVAAKTRVCAWDRPGFGLSGPSPKPPTVDYTTTDLQEALKAGRIEGPYVVVGHSLGGYESLLLKDREPSKVAGMVLVDPSFPDQYVRIARLAPPELAEAVNQPAPFVAYLNKCSAALRGGTLRHQGPDPDGCLHPQWPPEYPAELQAVLSEGAATSTLEAIASAMDTMAFYGTPQLLEQDAKIAIRPGRNYGNMPLIVLTAGDSPSPPGATNRAFALFVARQAEWIRGHDEIAALSTRGVNRTVAGSSHYIQQIKPQVVIDAIEEVVDEVRGSLHGH